MLLSRLARRAVLSFVGLALAVSTASAVTYQDGQLFLGFRASDGTGSTKDILVNIGSGADLATASSPVTLPATTNLGADLSSSALFGADWSSRTDVFWGVAGTTGSFNPVAGDPAKTLFATRARLVPTIRSTPWQRDTDGSQGVTTSKIKTLISAFTGAGTSNTPNGLIQLSAGTNSWASFQPGGVNAGAAPGVSFAAFNPTIEANFANGAAKSVLDLYKLTPGSGDGAYLGFFRISTAGVVTFVPAALSSISFDEAQVDVDEDVAGGMAVLHLTRSGDTTAAATVTAATTPGSATSADFTSTNTQVTFDAGATDATVQIPITVRAGYQGDRSFTVTLSAASAGSALITPSTTTVTIKESTAAAAGVITFANATYQFAPLSGSGSPNTLAIGLTRQNPSAAAVAVTVTVSGGTLTNGTHYTLASPKTVTFGASAGSTTLNIPLKAIADGALPGTIVLTLSNATNGAVVGVQSTTTITVAAPPASATVNFAAATYSGLEGTDITVTINRGGGSAGAASVQIVRTGGTAIQNADFALSTSMVSWADGDGTPKTILVSAVKDYTTEANETVILALKSPSGLNVGSTGSTTVTISDVDTAPPALSITAPLNGARPAGSNVVVTGLVSDNQGVGSVSVRLDGGTAQNATITGNSWSLTLTPEQGVHTIQVSAVDQAGNRSNTLSRTFTFFNVRAALTGTYTGLISAAAGLANPSDYNGLATIVVTSTGAFSGRLTMSGVALPIAGTFNNAGSARFGTTGTPSVAIVKAARPDGVFLGYLSLDIDLTGGRKITGSIADGTVGATPLATIAHADQSYYSATNPVPDSVVNLTQEKGKYTALFQAQAAPNNGTAAISYPQGDGWGLVTVTKAGAVSVSGRLADGTVVSYANILTKNNEWPVFIALYPDATKVPRGYLTGNVAFDATQPNTDAAGTGLRWFKPAGASAAGVYPNGWPKGIKVDFAASKYLLPSVAANSANTKTIFGPSLTAPFAVTTSLTEGGLNSDISVAGTVSATSVVTQDTVNPAVVKVTLAPATGTFSGTFTHNGNSRAAAFTGVVYQKKPSASGYFLYTPAGQAYLSGLVEIAP